MTASSPPRSFDELYGLRVGRVTDSLADARLEVGDKVRQPFGLVHGGVYASIAEALATLGTIEGIAPDEVAVGLSNTTSFLRPVKDGLLRAEARALHRGRTTRLWDVHIYDDKERLCALTRVTVAVRRERDEIER